MVINKLKSALLLAVVVAATCSWKHIDMNSEAMSSRSLYSVIRDNQKDGYEVPKIIRKGVPSQLLERFSYKTSYNKETRTPNWVGWALTSEHTDGEYDATELQFGRSYCVTAGTWHYMAVSDDAKVFVVENADVSKENTDELNIEEQNIILAV